MTKQQVTKKGIGIRLCGYGNDVRVENCSACIYFIEVTNSCKKRDEFISYLHSQGLVIKVDRKLPDLYNQLLETPKSAQRTKETPSDLFIYLTGQYDYQQDMLEAGYVAVEPLIEERNK